MRLRSPLIAAARLVSLAAVRSTILALIVSSSALLFASVQATLPELTEPVNDFARVIDAQSAREMDRVIRALTAASGDVVVVATVSGVEPYADIRELAVKLFENRGRGIGERGKDNGLLILLAMKERRVWIEVGYGLEEWITDGFAGETSRDYMAPEFRNGRYGAGLLAGTVRIVGRIARGRHVQLNGVEIPVERQEPRRISISWIILIFILIVIISRMSGGSGRRFRPSGWSGWSSGVGPFGGGWGGGFGGGGGGFGGGFGGGGGGFGGFGGGRSGGGGGGAGW